MIYCTLLFTFKAAIIKAIESLNLNDIDIWRERRVHEHLNQPIDAFHGRIPSGSME